MGDLDSMANSGGFSASMKSQASNATLRGQKVKPAGTRPMSLLETVPVHGPRVLEHNDDMHELADTMDVRVRALLDGQGDDMYIAFRAHMYTVMQQIWDLRKMAEYQEEKTRKDCRIRNVERELEWFMSEALRLDHLAKITTKECENWRAKAMELAQRKKLHADQVKTHKKINKVLNLATDDPPPNSCAWPISPVAGNHSARGSPRKQQLVSKSSNSCIANKQMQVISSQSALSTTSTALPSKQMQVVSSQSALSTTSTAPPNKHMHVVSSQSAISTTSSVLSPKLSPGRPSLSSSPPTKRSGAMSARGTGGSPPMANEKEQWYVDTIRELQEKLKKQQNETRVLKSARASSFTHKSDLEEFFLKCVNEARKDLDRGQRLFSERERERCDEEKVIETLLGSENAMIFIYEQIFPHRVGNTRRFMEGDRHLGIVSSEILNSAKQKPLAPL